MNRWLGLLLIILGLIVTVFGSVGILIYSIYDLIVNFDKLTGIQIFWDIVWIVCRDIIAILVGGILYIFGTKLMDS